MQVAIIGGVEKDGTFCEWKGLNMADVLSWYCMTDTTTVIVPQSVLERCLNYRDRISRGFTGPMRKVHHS